MKKMLEGSEGDWKEFMAETFDSLWEEGTIRKGSPPHGRQPIKMHLDFKSKRVADGSIKRFESRFVAKGLVERSGVDIFEKFSPVVRLDTRWTTLAVSASKEWNIKVLNFEQAYLNAPLGLGMVFC